MQMSQAVGQFLIALVRRGLMGLLLAMLPLWAQAQSQGGTADLQITKSGPTRANGGDKVEYQLVMDNNGPNDASGATFVDMLPAGLTILLVVAAFNFLGDSLRDAIDPAHTTLQGVSL